MGTVDVRRVIRAPGRLAINPTNLAQAWPHGGTGLGATNKVMLISYGASYPVTIEAFGGEPVEHLEKGEVWGLGFHMRAWDPNALATLFPNTSVGSVSQKRGVSAPGAVKAGQWISDRSVKLVFTPEGATHAQSATQQDVDVPFVVLYKALPLLQAQAELVLARTDELKVPALFMGIRNASSQILEMRPRADITL